MNAIHCCIKIAPQHHHTLGWYVLSAALTIVPIEYVIELIDS